MVNGARYLDPRTSCWLSTDPALGDYIPSAPINDEAKKANQNLPGMGGVFNVVNFHLYHYAGNNPIKYVDPDGKFFGAAAIGATAPVWVPSLIKGGAFFGAAIIGTILGQKIGEATKTKNNESYSITIQIQGPSIKENQRKGSNQGSHSITIISKNPITRNQTRVALDTVVNRLSFDEKGALAPSIVDASKFIEKVADAGGTGQNYQSFSQINGDRIDMIINGKINIIPD